MQNRAYVGAHDRCAGGGYTRVMEGGEGRGEKIGGENEGIFGYFKNLY